MRPVRPAPAAGAGAILRRLVPALLLAASVRAQTPPLTPDIPAKFEWPTADYDYVKREVMVPMRDGVRLHTVIVIPKNAKRGPIVLTRTPYDASAHASRNHSRSRVAILPIGMDVFAADGYICVLQDIRGKYGSEGQYVMTRPPRGPLNATAVDPSTDAWDTVDWLVKNVPESNGRVGMLGASYEGFTVVMALLDPHPALKVAAPQAPMIDGWMGDDWFHYGAFRQVNLDYFVRQTAQRGKGETIVRAGYDDYENFLRAGSAGDFARAAGFEQLPWWHKVSEHPAYDAYWQQLALDRLLASKPLKVPTMWVAGLWDQEDIWGAIHAYPSLEAKDVSNDRNFLVLGPWYHGQMNNDGNALEPLKFDGDTALQFRRGILKPFFDQYLKDGAPKADTPPVLVYDAGSNEWDRFKAWPAGGDPAWKAKPSALYLRPGFGLGFEAPPASGTEYDEYVSDPAKPVPFTQRPVRFGDVYAWRHWLVADQRPFSDRTDVLAYVTEPLSQPVRISGAPAVNLVASTSGTDSDWVVKLIDVYPDEDPARPEMGGYELAIAMDIFRGRYRESFADPKALEPGKPLAYRFTLPAANHVFLPGHRIMVQIQSSWFPLYDRNPQTFVPNIFFAKPADYIKAVQRVYHSTAEASFITLPVVEHR